MSYSTAGWVFAISESIYIVKANRLLVAGGVAYVGVYGRSDYQYYSPALVYYNNLGSREDFISEGEMKKFVLLNHLTPCTQRPLTRSGTTLV